MERDVGSCLGGLTGNARAPTIRLTAVDTARARATNQKSSIDEPSQNGLTLVRLQAKQTLRLCRREGQAGHLEELAPHALSHE